MRVRANVNAPHRSQRGSLLVEFVLGIVFIGVVIGPLLLYVTRIQDLGSAMGQEGRREAWRSFNDQAIAAGIDPSLAPALASTLNPSIPSVAALPVKTVSVAAQAGVVEIVPLQAVLGNSIAEPRAAGAGFELGPGLSVAAISEPAAPLTPIVMAVPVVTPADGAVLSTTDLTAAGGGQPYTLSVQAVASAGSTVDLAFNQPNGVARGYGAAARTVTAVDLLNRVNGVAWAEYTGNATAGDQSATLSDGRTRWFVTRSDGRVQIYEPSPTVPFAYQISLGSPVIARAGVENPAGASLTFDYAGYVAVQDGSTALTIDFPAAVKAAFGSAWAAQSVGFQWTFGGSAGPFSGDMKQFFDPGALSSWSDAVAVAAKAVVPVGALATDASWTLVRQKTVLGVPVQSTTADSTGFFTPGPMQFTAPESADGTPVGRLSVNNTVSTGTSLSVSVAP